MVLGFAAACVVRLTAASAVPQAPADVATLLTAVGERVVNYYRRAQSVICTERSTVQPIDRNWSQQGFARTVESELHVELDATDGEGLPEARLVRDVRRVNGRLPRESDQKSRNGCTDPNPLSPEPLAFLLPSHRNEYLFTSVRRGREANRSALILDFASADRRSRPELIEDETHEDCFDWKGPLAMRGQVWLDEETFDVLRIDRRLTGPADLRVPIRLQRRYSFEPFVVLDRHEVTIHFRPVAFKDPDEFLLLPESIDSLTILRSGLQSIRRTERFSEYRRFLTGGRVKGE